MLIKKLAVVTTHPIQYNAPWFQLLAQEENIDLKIFYTWSQTSEKVKDKTFGREIKWDIPLLEGYNYEFVENVSKNPNSSHFSGIDNPDLIHKLKQFLPDTILVFGWSFKSHLKVLRHFHGKTPLWFRGDSTLIDEKAGLKTILRRLILTWVYRHVDKVLYVGQANKAYFLKHGIQEKQLIHAPHAIDNKRFNDEKNNDNYDKKALDWRENLGYKNTEILVLFAGKFEEKKQPDLLAKAVIVANKNRQQKVHLLLVGNGPLEDELKLKYKNEPYIKFLPFQNQSMMPIVYRLGDVLCLPSRGPGETWGLAVNESMASGRSVIVSDKVGCAADLVKHSNSKIFPFNNLHSLSNILQTIEKNHLLQAGILDKAYIADWNYAKIIAAIRENI